MGYPVIDVKKTGKKISSAIRSSRHSVGDVAAYLGTDKTSVYRYMRGDVLPSIDRLLALSLYLDSVNAINDLIAYN